MSLILENNDKIMIKSLFSLMTQEMGLKTRQKLMMLGQGLHLGGAGPRGLRDKGRPSKHKMESQLRWTPVLVCLILSVLVLM